MGNTGVVTGHNPNVIKSADYRIDIGPGGRGCQRGDRDGGTPEKVAAVQASYMGQSLKGMPGKA